MARSAAALLAETLDAHGGDLIYGVPGASYLAVIDALIERPHVRVSLNYLPAYAAARA
jgi:thiamine pyrophosphate-dependent acetolactate synthase large subunit-like protein